MSDRELLRELHETSGRVLGGVTWAARADNQDTTMGQVCKALLMTTQYQAWADVWWRVGEALREQNSRPRDLGKEEALGHLPPGGRGD